MSRRAAYTRHDPMVIRCGAYGHAFFDTDSDWKPRMGTPLTFRCERCDSVRHDTVGVRDNLVLDRNYYYSLGYRALLDERESRTYWRGVLIALRRQEAKQAGDSNIVHLPQRKRA